MITEELELEYLGLSGWSRKWLMGRYPCYIRSGSLGWELWSGGMGSSYFSLRDRLELPSNSVSYFRAIWELYYGVDGLGYGESPGELVCCVSENGGEYRSEYYLPIFSCIRSEREYPPMDVSLGSIREPIEGEEFERVFVGTGGSRLESYLRMYSSACSYYYESRMPSLSEIVGILEVFKDRDGYDSVEIERDGASLPGRIMSAGYSNFRSGEEVSSIVWDASESFYGEIHCLEGDYRIYTDYGKESSDKQLSLKINVIRGPDWVAVNK